MDYCRGNGWMLKIAEKRATRTIGTSEEIKKIKKVVLHLGTQFTRLQINEIAEECGIYNSQEIIDTVRDMIKNKEIYAKYFLSSKTVAFNQQANIDEIDKLMEAYKDWEEKGLKKIKEKI